MKFTAICNAHNPNQPAYEIYTSYRVYFYVSKIEKLISALQENKQIVCYLDENMIDIEKSICAKLENLKDIQVILSKDNIKEMFIK